MVADPPNLAAPLRVLILDDSPDDAQLLERAIRHEGYAPAVRRVDNPAAMRAALLEAEWDVVLSDYTMPTFTALDALALLHTLQFDLPFIIVSGTIDEAMAVDVLKAGAHDFVLKGHLTRLGPAIAREQREAVARRRQRETEAALKMRTDELAAMTEQLWQAAKLATLGELSASVAHELNNPLFNVLLHLQVLRGQLLPDDPHQAALASIDEEVRRMSRLVANLLQFSRRSTRQFSSLNLADELTNTLELMAFHLRQRHIVVVTDYAPAPPVRADRQQLRQVFLNLLTNAADAMPQGGTLTARVCPAPALTVVELADTGAGIPPEALSRIWEPFFTTKPEGKGTGLGLGICRHIVEEHGGSITLDSQPGHGTVARVTLPAASETASVSR